MKKYNNVFLMNIWSVSKQKGIYTKRLNIFFIQSKINKAIRRNTRKVMRSIYYKDMKKWDLKRYRKNIK